MKEVKPTENTALALSETKIQEPYSTEEDEEGSDFWTKLSTLSLLPGFISNIYWLGTFFDLLFEQEPEILELSYPGLFVGILLSLFATSGMMYCQYNLNFLNQSSDEPEDAEDGWVNEISCGEKLLNYTALAGDWLDTAGYRAAPLVFITNLTTNNTLSRKTQIGIQVGTLLFGFLTSVADVRTSKHNIEKINKINKTEDDENEVDSGSDCWTKLSTLSELAGLASDVYWLGSLLDLCVSLEPKIFGLSFYGLSVGISLGIYGTAGNMYCQYKINSLNQSNAIFKNLKTGNHEYKISCGKKIFNYTMIGGEWLDNAGYKAAPIIFVTDLATKQKLSRWTKIGVQLGTTAFGFFTSVGEMRTSKNTLEKINKLECIKNGDSICHNSI